MTDAVVIDETVIDMTDAGARGRDGITGDYVSLKHEPDSTGNVWVVAPIRPGAVYDAVSTYTAYVVEETEATSLAIRVVGVNNEGDQRTLKYANSDTVFDPSLAALGDIIIFTGKPVNPDDPTEGFTHWEYIGPAGGPASEAEVLAGTGTSPVTPPTLGAWGEAGRAQAERVSYQSENELVTANKPVRIEMKDPTRIEVIVRPIDDDYRDGYARFYSDHTIWEMRNLRGIYHAGLAADCWETSSMASVFHEKKVAHCNFAWDRILGGSTNNGQTPSAFNAVLFGGRATDTAATINGLQGSGPFHNNFDQTTSALIVYGGVKNGVTIPDGTDIQSTLKPGDIINATQFDIVGNRVLNGPGGLKFADVNLLRRFGGGRQYTLNDEVAFVTDPATGLTVGTLFNCMFRNADKMQARNKAGVVSAVEDVGARDSRIFSFTDGVRTTGWNSADGGRAFEIEQPVGYQPFRRQGSEVAFASENYPLVIDEATGPKVRQYVRQGSTSFDVEPGTLSFLSYMQGVRADGA